MMADPDDESQATRHPSGLPEPSNFVSIANE
jgi:hypothetical protein